MKKTLSDSVVLSSIPTVIKFTDKEGNIKKFEGRKCGQKLYPHKNVKKAIKRIEQEIIFKMKDKRINLIILKDIVGKELLK